MRIGFIGAGLMGKTMGVLLSSCGYEVVGYCSRSETSALRVAKEVGCKFWSDPGKLAGNCEVLFITTPDDSIEQVVLTLKEKECLQLGQVVVHMSGSHTSKILEPAVCAGAHALSMHPLQSCASTEEALASLPRSVFSLEGDQEAVKMGKAMVSRIGAQYVVLSTEDKVLYHAAACMASNYLVALLDGALELLQMSGVEEDFSVPALMPLVEGTLNNLKVMTPVDALTGPISRGDIGTITRHIKSLEEKAPDMLDIYKVLGRRTLKLVVQKDKLDGEKIKALNELFRN